MRKFSAQVWLKSALVKFRASAMLTHRKGMRVEKGDRRKSPEPTMLTTVVTPKTLVFPQSVFPYALRASSS